MIKVVTTYNALLGGDYFQTSKCILSSFYQYRILWHTNGSVEIIKIDANFFMATLNGTDALLYKEMWT